MKYIYLIAAALVLTACGGEAKDSSPALNAKTSNEWKAADATSAKPKQGVLPDMTQYSQDVCTRYGPKIGTERAKVQSFIKNFFVVVGPKTKMTSSFETYTLPDGRVMIQADTLNMPDVPSDQEIIAIFENDALTECGVRLKCGSGKDWQAKFCG